MSNPSSKQYNGNGKVVHAPDSSPISTRTAIGSVGGSSSSNGVGRSGSNSTHRPSGSSSFGSSFTQGIRRPASGASSSAKPPTSRIGLLGGAQSPYALPNAGKMKSVPSLNLDQYKFRDANGSGTSVNSSKNRGGTSTNVARAVSISSGDEDSDDDGASRRQAPRRKFKRGKPPSESPSPVKTRPTTARAGSSSSPIDVSDSGDETTTNPALQRLHDLFKGRFSMKKCADALRQGGGYSTAVGILRDRERAEASGSSMGRSSSAGGSSIGSSSFNKRLKIDGSTPSSRTISLGSSRASSVASSPAPTAESLRRMRDASSSKAQLKAKRRRDASDDSGSDGGGFEEDSDREQSKRARNAVHWFNAATEETLIETIGCSPAQAKTIANLRPFDDADDAEEKLRRTKGVTGKLFTDYIDLLASFHTVDQVLKRCERRAEMLEKASSSEAIAADKLHLKGKPEGMADDFDLKDYQLDGVNWLSLRYRNATSCILADDMGTGKTCQVIAFLCDLKARGEKGVNLVVAPSSTIENWSRELKRFGPSLNFIVFAGNQNERREIRFEIEEDRHPDLDVVLSSYNSATSKTDLKFFKKFGFNCCVYDEGHQLKNQATQNYKNLMQVRAEWRLLLTGTPLQNNLLELMSLLKFIMPKDFKDTTEAFETIFKAKGSAATARGSQLSKSRVDRARAMMGPFVLRRLKDNVLSLPPKNIRVEYCDMTPFQGKVYRKVLARTRVDLEQQAAGDAPKSKKDQSANILMRLRKAAIHPMLFRTTFTAERIRALAKDYVKEPQFMDEDLARLQEDFAINSDAELSSLASQYPATRKHQVPGEAWLNSGKILALRRLIEEIRGRGEKLVVFSQFEMCLFLLMAALDEMNTTWIAFSGRTKVEERQDVIDEFQTNPDITVFLLTTKAGGVGVNLTAANWVIMLDQDFNPQNDKQAEDRCWRIGQEREVNVVKLISRGTIDEDILALGQQKLELAARVSGVEKKRAVAGLAPTVNGVANGDATAEEKAKAAVAAGADPADGAAVTADLMDDDQQQEKTAQTLMSKLRNRNGATGGGGDGKEGDAADGDADDDSDDGFELLE
ncbi:hypothetical protein BDZ90DRAFT_232088 [Jaminaea rosea]|uniref:Uncharacterized protein n=1 Tax=Jaminaea rosea TaxID=1569628 RepID=A0A316UQU4_9BASI|nr:hypothetical protein BDZ90DRAFT_232088 [Jaminaea rosea]PWN27679.1 hypothetical protein BDZ90DRAFT_232088 [Jaminaea rosea]